MQTHGVPDRRIRLAPRWEFARKQVVPAVGPRPIPRPIPRQEEAKIENVETAPRWEFGPRPEAARPAVQHIQAPRVQRVLQNVVQALRRVAVVPEIDSGRRRKVDDSHPGDHFYWESSRQHREYFNELHEYYMKKRKKKPKAPERKSGKGFYYESPEHWQEWARGDSPENYRPRVGQHHQHNFKDHIHENVDIHVFHRQLECYVHKRATKANVLYLAHVLKKETGRLYTVKDNGKLKYLTDLTGEETEKEIVARLPQRKPYALFLRMHGNSHHESSFVGGTLWRSPEYQAHLHNHLKSI